MPIVTVKESAKPRVRRRRRQPKIGNSYLPSVQRAIGISRSQVVKLRYCQQVVLAPNTASYAYIVLSANGLYSPNIGASANVSTSTSHQPMAFDQYAPFYNDYIVKSSKLTVSFSCVNSNTVASGAGVATVLLSDSASALTNPQNVIEQGRAAWKHFNPNACSSPISLSVNFDAKKFWDLKDIADNQKNVGAAFSANPSEQAYYHIAYFCNDPSTSTTVGPYCWLVIDYLCLLTGPADLASS